MKTRYFTLLALLTTVMARGEWIPIEEDDNLNRFTLAPRMGLRVNASFQNSATPMPPIMAAGAKDREYDNGFVRVDNSGNAGGNSSWFKFVNDAQYNPAGAGGNGTLAYNYSASPLDNYSKGARDGFLTGGEVGYERTLFIRRLSEKYKLKIGVAANYNYEWFDTQDNSSAAGLVNTVSDLYSLNGVPLIPPSVLGGPFEGSPNGGLALITGAPTASSTAPTPATATAQSSLSGSFYGLKIGPTADLLVGKKVTLNLRGGITAVYASTRLKHSETLNVVGVSTPVGRTYENDAKSWMAGPFAAAQVRYDLGNGWDAFFGAEWQRLSSRTINAGPRSATIGMDKTIFFQIGVGVSF